ncbi:thioredoxin domain-containing protein [Candidatus Woesearchaeota archaeon]|nr:thioredoxin domain-containing protein [Candidatus Woesearchaeota archaeon]
MEEEKQSTVTIKKTTVWKALSGVLFLLLLASIYTSGFGIFDKSPTGGTVVEDKTKPENTIQRIDTSDWDLSNQPFLGEEDAPIEMIVFDDFQCPFCARFEQQSFQDIKKEYIDTGKVKFIYMHFPLGFHSMAAPAAEASECAKDQGKFWEYHDLIFENQGSLNEANLIKWAEELELDMDKFNTCYESGKYTEQVQAEMQLGQSAGIKGTPSFLINGKLAVGALPMDDYRGQNGMEKGFRSLLDEELE